METHYTDIRDPRCGLPRVPREKALPLAEARTIPCPFVAQYETIDSTGYLWRWETQPRLGKSMGEYLWSAWGFGQSQCVGKVVGGAVGCRAVRG